MSTLYAAVLPTAGGGRKIVCTYTSISIFSLRISISMNWVEIVINHNLIILKLNKTNIRKFTCNYLKVIYYDIQMFTY